MTADSALKLGTLVIALYAAALSTYSLILKRREKARQVKVTLKRAVPYGIPGCHDPAFLIEATNPGERTVALANCVLRLKDGSYLSVPVANREVRFPHSLAEGENCKCWAELSDIARELHEHHFAGEVRVAGEFIDALGNSYRSKWTRFRIGEWLRV